MAKRFTDTEIWDEDWFIDLPNQYKLMYLYIKDKCDHSGFWRPNKRKLSMVLNGTIIYYDEFLKAVNTVDEASGKEKTRIIVLENGRWFLTKFIPFQCGPSFKIKIGAHRSALELLIYNNIHPSQVPNFDWCGFENYDLEQLRKIAHAKGLYRLSLQDAYGKGSEIEKEQEKDKDTEQDNIGGKGGVGEKPRFKLQGLYDTPWLAADRSKREFKNVEEDDFAKWREFVDWIIENGYEELFRSDFFVHPADFKQLIVKNGFTKDIWEPVIKKMIGTGIKKEHNIYFRIQDYIKYSANDSKKPASSLNSGAANYDNMEKW